MSVLKSHPWRSMDGQIAILVFVLLLAVVIGVFWNWNYIQSMNWSLPSLPENPALQMVLVLVVIIIVLFVYAIYKAKEPRAMRGS